MQRSIKMVHCYHCGAETASLRFLNQVFCSPGCALIYKSRLLEELDIDIKRIKAEIRHDKDTIRRPAEQALSVVCHNPSLEVLNARSKQERILTNVQGWIRDNQEQVKALEQQLILVEGAPLQAKL